MKRKIILIAVLFIDTIFMILALRAVPTEKSRIVFLSIFLMITMLLIVIVFGRMLIKILFLFKNIVIVEDLVEELDMDKKKCQICDSIMDKNIKICPHCGHDTTFK